MSPLITFSKTAIAEVQRMLQHTDRATAATVTHIQLALDLIPSECAQHQYQLGFYEDNLAHEEGLTIPITLSPHHSANGAITTHSPLTISLTISSKYQALLDGLNIDFSEDLMGGGFRFENPNASRTCSCGYAFDTVAV